MHRLKTAIFTYYAGPIYVIQQLSVFTYMYIQEVQKEFILITLDLITSYNGHAGALC